MKPNRYTSNRRQFLIGSAAAAILAPPAWACGWDKDTLRDEIQRKATEFDLITGQLPSHSEAWYLRRESESRQTLTATPGDLSAHDDLGTALLKLKRYDESDVVFAAALALDADRYETLSNLGVLRKKQGRLEEAAEFISKALKKKPEGHLGVGDWYTRALKWRTRENPNRSFLNVGYDEVLEPMEMVATDDPKRWFELEDAFYVFSGQSHVAIGSVRRAGLTPSKYSLARPDSSEDREQFLALLKRDHERLRKLIRYDNHFSDAHLILGDELTQGIENLDLAALAWSRAKTLGHPRADRLDLRIGGAAMHWNEADVGVSREQLATGVAHAMASSAKWVEAFHAMETKLVDAGRTPTFEETETALEESGVQRFRAEDMDRWTVKG